MTVLAPHLSLEDRVFDAWYRRQVTLEAAVGSDQPGLLVALSDWKAAQSELTDTVVAQTLGARSSCVSDVHDAIDCARSGLSVMGWCEPCLERAPLPPILRDVARAAHRVGARQ